MELKIGDPVTLKSGGASMVIAQIVAHKAQCIWQDGAKTYREWFPLVVLTKSEISF